MPGVGGCGGLEAGRGSRETSAVPRLIFILPLLLIFGGVVGGGHYYIAQRLVVDASLSPGLEAVLVWGIALCAASLILQPIGERLFEPQWARMIAWPASIWMGLFFYLFLLVCFSDLLIFVVEFSDPTLLFQAGASSWFESFGPGQLRATLVLLAAGVFGALGLLGLRVTARSSRSILIGSVSILW